MKKIIQKIIAVQINLSLKIATAYLKWQNKRLKSKLEKPETKLRINGILKK